MGLKLKLIGILLIFIGGLGIVTKVPNLIVSSLVDGINPLIKLGITNPSTDSLFVDVIILFTMVLIGVALLMKTGKKKIKIK